MIRVERFAPERWDDFLAVHSAAKGAEFCRCVAWWVPSWEGWMARTPAQNLELRRELCARGEYDGYLAYVDALAVGWCQVGPRDRLKKLVAQFGLEPDPDAWAITCFQVDPDRRGQGVAGALLAQVLMDLPSRGARRLEAFPKRGVGCEAGALWNGPEAMYLRAGFQVVREDLQRPVLARELGSGAP